MATIEKQKVRARVELGNITVETPNVVSFSVNRARNQTSANFSASLRIEYTEINSSTELLAETIVIKAGLKNNLKTIFTGKVEKCVVNPVRVDASKVILNLSGKDVLSVLEGQNINRRLKTYRDGSSPPERWASVTGVIKHSTPTIQKFKEKIEDKKPKVTNRKPEFPLYKTPDAFDVNRGIPTRVYGGIEISSGEIESEEIE